MSGVLLAIGAGLRATGSIMQARAAAAETEAQEAVSEYKAAVQEQEAQAIEQQTVFEQQRLAEESQRRLSTMRAEIAGAGGVTTAGVSVLLQARQAAEDELNKMLTGYRGQTAAARARTQGAIDVAQAKIYKRRAKTRERAGYIKAGSTLLEGFRQMEF